jgi:hypothetical protein
VYVGHARNGKSFQNCEVHKVHDGKITSTEVYFGWDLPHRAPKGGFVNDQKTSGL